MTNRAVGPGGRVHDLATPFAVLSDDALEHNIATMADWCLRSGVELAPHGKTSMAPTLFRRQLDAGATAITAATPAQVRVMRAHDVTSVHLASQLVQPREARWIGAELTDDPGFSFVSWVDSAAGVEVLAAAGEATGAVFDVLLEIGADGGRTGCRTPAQRAEVARTVAATPYVRMVGVTGYEGIVGGARTPESLRAVRLYLGTLREAAAELDLDGTVVLSAGGSMFFDVVADELGRGRPPEKTRVVVRSGCYVAHDHGLFWENSPFAQAESDVHLTPALTVWGTVLSRPEPGRAYLDVGRRNASFDQGLPIPLRRLPAGSAESHDLTGVTVIALNDQHAYLDVPASTALSVGDRVELGISHPCTTFDKWREIPLIDATGTILEVVDTYFA